ncbi:MAG TPA: hypothetical protein VIU39_11120 [Anaerolineales bacterium]
MEPAPVMGDGFIGGAKMATKSEKWYVKYAWILIFLFGLLTVIAAPINLLGTPPNPPSPEKLTGLTLDQIEARTPGMLDYISSISRQLGNFMLAMGVLLMGIASVPFRKGERWAWYISWILPLLLVIQLVNSRGGFGWQADLVSLGIALAGLFLPLRKFFPKRAGFSRQETAPKVAGQ